MYKTGVLCDYNVTISKDYDRYKVFYERGNFKGSCVYRELTLNGIKKPINQRCLLMTECDMGDIIEDLHMTFTLSSEDLETISSDIRNHSYDKLSEYLSGNGE